MQEPDLLFVIPTYRVREVGETVEQYDDHFWRNGHSVRMIVFDDSSPANQEKYFQLLELSIAFDYEGEVTAQDAEETLDKIYRVYERSLEAAEATNNPERVKALRLFAANLQKAFYGFEPDFFEQNLLRIVDDVVSVIKGSIELWPSLVEICYFQKDRKGLPQIRVRNQKLR